MKYIKDWWNLMVQSTVIYWMAGLVVINVIAWNTPNRLFCLGMLAFITLASIVLTLIKNTK